MPNTHIETGSDRVLVGDLTPGMFVLGIKKKMARPARILATHSVNSGRVLCVHLSNGAAVWLGPGVRVIRDGCGWTIADKLHVGDKIRTLHGNVTVEVIERFDGRTSLVGIAVEGKHDICAEGVVCRP